MKKLLTLAVFFSAFASAAFAQVEFEQIKSRTQEKLHVTGFFDYYPFGQYENNVYSGVFKSFIEYFSDYFLCFHLLLFLRINVYCPASQQLFSAVTGIDAHKCSMSSEYLCAPAFP